MGIYAELLNQLRREQEKAQLQVTKLGQAIEAIEGLRLTDSATLQNGKRIVSAATRRKLSLAQRARWHTQKGKSTPGAGSSTLKAKPALSVSTRRKIAAAQRARWAK